MLKQLPRYRQLTPKKLKKEEQRAPKSTLLTKTKSETEYSSSWLLAQYNKYIVESRKLCSYADPDNIGPIINIDYKNIRTIIEVNHLKQYFKEHQIPQPLF